MITSRGTGAFLFLWCEKRDNGVGKLQYVGHKTTKQPYNEGNQNDCQYNGRPSCSLLSKAIFGTVFEVLGNVEMIFGKIDFVRSVLPFFTQKRLFLAAKYDLSQERTAAQLASHDRAPKRAGIKQRHRLFG